MNATVKSGGLQLVGGEELTLRSAHVHPGDVLQWVDGGGEAKLPSLVSWVVREDDTGLVILGLAGRKALALRADAMAEVVRGMREALS